MKGGAMKKWAPLLLMLAVVLSALAVGSLQGNGNQTPAQRTVSIASRVRCPTCQGLSVAQSKTPVSRGIFDEIERQVAAGRSDAQITSYLASRYGDSILTNPPSSGIGAVVWVLPVIVLAGAAGGLAMSLRRWRQARSASDPTSDDLDLVTRARAEAAS